VVADPEYLVQGRGQDLAKIFHEEIEKVESCRKRVAGATRVDKIYSILDYSYRSKSCAGDGFILIGDAYGFLDPIYSSGVLLALKMAELAADSIHEAFRTGDFSGARLGHYQAKLDNGIESMRKLVYAFYNEGFSFSQFLKKYPDQRTNIITLLMGDVFKEGVDNIYGPMADFAVIPPPLYEQLDGTPVSVKESAPGGEEVMSAKYREYDDAVLQEAGD
jgi:flavin-dependent dehydrogenase